MLNHVSVTPRKKRIRGTTAVTAPVDENEVLLEVDDSEADDDE